LEKGSRHYVSSVTFLIRANDMPGVMLTQIFLPDQVYVWKIHHSRIFPVNECLDCVLGRIIIVDVNVDVVIDVKKPTPRSYRNTVLLENRTHLALLREPTPGISGFVQGRSSLRTHCSLYHPPYIWRSRPRQADLCQRRGPYPGS